MISQHAVASGPDSVGDGRADVAEPVARLGGRDAPVQRRVGGRDQGEVLRAWPADHEADRRVAAPVLEEGPAVDTDQVAVGELGLVGDAVHHRVVDAGAGDARIRGRRPGRVVVEEGGGGPGLLDDRGRHLVQFGERHPDIGPVAGRGQRVGDDPAGFAQQPDLTFRLQLDHDPLPPSLSCPRSV
jgi:hypothetical protein